MNQGHHDLSHHGQDPAKIAQLKILELEKMKTLRDFLGQLRATKEDGESLLDRTMVFFGSNLGDAGKHSVKNMPIILALAASGTASTWHSTRTTTRRSATSMSACSNGWGSRPIGSAAAPRRCPGSRREPEDHLRPDRRG